MLVVERQVPYTRSLTIKTISYAMNNGTHSATFNWFGIDAVAGLFFRRKIY